MQVIFTSIWVKDWGELECQPPITFKPGGYGRFFFSWHFNGQPQNVVRRFDHRLTLPLSDTMTGRHGMDCLKGLQERVCRVSQDQQRRHHFTSLSESYYLHDEAEDGGSMFNRASHERKREHLGILLRNCIDLLGQLPTLINQNTLAASARNRSAHGTMSNQALTICSKFETS